jgi:hypothetical protein
MSMNQPDIEQIQRAVATSLHNHTLASNRRLLPFEHRPSTDDGQHARGIFGCGHARLGNPPRKLTPHRSRSVTFAVTGSPYAAAVLGGSINPTM